MNFYRPEKMSGFFYFLPIAAMAVALLIWTDPDYAREVVIRNDWSSISAGSVFKKLEIVEKIQEGIELLEQSPSLAYESRGGVLLRKQVALALLNKETGEVFEKRVLVNEEESKNYKKTGILVLEPVKTDETLNIQPQWWNSFNTFYKVREHPELIVIANKYLFPSEYITGLPEKSSGRYTDIVYVPYSKDLHTKEIVEAGKEYLEKNINQAFAELDNAKVNSLATPSSLVTAGINKDFVRNIILVEHVDPGGFNSADDGGQELAERVLAVIGANQKSAYRYTGSPAGASGLAQFIKPTYDSMVARYPKAKLLKNYNAGMANHVNAIKAMVLFFDSHKKDIAGKITRRDIVSSLGITEEMLAATYNGGPGKVANSVNKFGLAWINSQLLPNTTRILRQETINYVKKFDAIKGLNLF